ncbi:phage tail tape measure protein [Acidiphilium multivorum]|jgi:TP901 family phage tail tape measure protein|uniref:phage tail tape measure protein n=1 Tax=Acidiphilium multivorum TaxID=62140 RepID=UPI001B8D264A|nr:phage tail tape measure protein [Acidiphilium multivorum]MBS3025341.1 phage tail tape measure protein [Acidiphilium multivorum]
MADDLAAEITLRLRAQMSGPIDEVKRLLSSLNETVGKLNETLGELTSALNDIKMSTQPAKEMGDYLARTNDAVKATEDLNKALRSSGAGAELAGAAAGRNAGAAREAGMAGPENADGAIDFIGGAIAGALGLSAVTALGDYQKTLRQIAITEKLSGPKADAEVARLSGLFDMLALKDRQSSLGLADAYFRMVTTHMPPAVVKAIMPDIGMMATAHDVSPYDLADAAFAINDSFKIGPKGMLSALAMLATAAKMAHFSLGNFGEHLKSIGGIAETMGLTGRGNLDRVAAGLETVIKNTTQPGQAAADYQDFLFYLSSPQFNMAGLRLGFKKRLESSQALFNKYHIKPVSFWHLESEANKKGVNEIDYMLQYFHKVTSRMNAGDRMKYLRTIFGNQQSANTVVSILEHWKDYHAMIAELGKVTNKTGDQDFATALKGANTQVAKFDEEMKQLERDIGNGLLKPLEVANFVLGAFVQSIRDLNTVVLPGLKVGLGNLTLAAASGLATWKAFVGVSGKLLGKGTKAASGSGESLLDDAVRVGKRGIEAAPEGGEAGLPGMIAAAILGAVGDKFEDSVKNSIRDAGAAVGDAIGRALGMHVVDVHVTNSDSALSGRHHTHNPAHLPRKTPPSGPLLNRP